MKYENVIGMKFGRLTVIEELPRFRTNNQTFRMVKCKCDCGNETIVKLPYITRNVRPVRSCGCLITENIKKQQKKVVEERNKNFENLEGRKFNKLNVIKFLGKNSDKHKGNNMWGCICDCGNIKQVTTTALTHGKVKSCGCLQSVENSKRLVERNKAIGFQGDLTGEKFGMLNVIGKEIINNSTYWRVWCDCEKDLPIEQRNIKTLRTYELRSGKIKSCGCSKFEDITSKKFNYLTVVKYVGSDKEHRFWECLCDCGNTTILPTHRIVSGSTKTCGKCFISSSLGENKVRTILKENNINFEEQYKFDDLFVKSEKYKLKFDFCIDGKYLIEYDGEQHYKMSNAWGGEERLKETQRYDKLKNEYCFKNGIPLIRIPYWHYNDLTLEDLQVETSKFLLKE